VAAKPRTVAPVAVARPRAAAPRVVYRLARYPAPRPYDGTHMLMLGVAY
jgi:hypothetical protein